MADAVISVIVGRLAILLIEEVLFLEGVRAEFERLQKEFLSIEGFLKTVDSIHNRDPSFRIWVADVRDVIYDVEDIIDNFLFPEEGIKNFFKRYARKLRNIFKLHRSGKDLKQIFSKLDDISERRKRYDTTNVGERTISASNRSEMLLRHSYPHQRDDDIIGLEVQKNRLMVELLKEEDRLCVVSIYDSSCFFSSDEEKCGREMVKKCCGLPLAIIVLGGLLASKRSLDEWENVSKQIETIGDDVVLSILSLSYIELPYHLKPLFQSPWMSCWC